jgi:hypothetical protein
MKSKFFNLFACALLLSFAAACGNKDGGSSKGNNGYSPTSNGLNASGTQAQTNLIAWYNSTVEGSYPSMSYPVRFVTRSTRSFSTSNGCNQQSVSVFGLNLGNINLCYDTQNGGSTSQSQEQVLLVANGSKSLNPKVAEAMSGILTPGQNGNLLVSVTQKPSTKSSGSVFVIQYVNSNQKSLVYVIDTGINSALNPVYSMDGGNGKEVTLISIYPSN